MGILPTVTWIYTASLQILLFYKRVNWNIESSVPCGGGVNVIDLPTDHQGPQ